jgi:CheY-like chemotaxis protein
VRKRILVIDDDPAVRETLVQVLSQRGYDVVLAANARTGLLCSTPRQTDLVITDIVMPMMEGLQTLREIQRARPHYRSSRSPAGAARARRFSRSQRRTSATCSRRKLNCRVRPPE